MKKKNFTLIEIIAVIAIIAILAGLTVGVSSLVMQKAADTKTTAAIKYVEMALEKYKTAHGYYPPSTNGGLDILSFKKDSTDLLGKYFDEKFRSANTRKIVLLKSGVYEEHLCIIDSYGNPMLYRCPGYFNKGKYDFGSVGKDKKVGDGASEENIVFKPGLVVRLNVVLTVSGRYEFRYDIAKPDPSHNYPKIEDEMFFIERSEYQEHFGKGDDIVNFAVNQQ